MDIQQTAQQSLFTELMKTQIKTSPNPEYNGYSRDDFDLFKRHLNSLYDKFEVEINENTMEPTVSAVELYLYEIVDDILEIKQTILNYRREEIEGERNVDPASFEKKGLKQISYFLNFQIEIINKTEIELRKNLQILKNTGDLKVDSVFKNKIRSKLTRVDLTAFLWCLAESEIFEFDGSHDNFVKFVEDNFQFYDKGKKTYGDMKHIGTLMTKFNDNNSSETNPEQSKKEVLNLLQNQTLPPIKSILIKNKWKKA